MDRTQQLDKAIASNRTNIDFINTYLGRVNWAEVIEVGLEAQVDEAKRRHQSKAYAERMSELQAERAKVVTLYQASRELLPQFVNKQWSEYEQALTEAYPHLANELANKLQAPLAERNILRSAHHYKDNYLRQYGYVTLQDNIVVI